MPHTYVAIYICTNSYNGAQYSSLTGYTCIHIHVYILDLCIMNIHGQTNSAQAITLMDASLTKIVQHPVAG